MSAQTSEGKMMLTLTQQVMERIAEIRELRKLIGQPLHSDAVVAGVALSEGLDAWIRDLRELRERQERAS